MIALRDMHKDDKPREKLLKYANRQQEYFLPIILDGASHIINTHTVFIGTLNQSFVHPREVFEDAIADRATGIILAVR